MSEVRSTTIVFGVLAAAALYTMWIVAIQNGALRYMFTACSPSTHTVRIWYTFIPGVDSLLCILVSFYHEILTLPKTHPFLQSLAAVNSVPVAITYLESYRDSSPSFVKKKPFLFGMMSQGIGSALAYPIYYAMYCRVVEAPRSTRLNDRGDGAWTVLPSLLLGYFLTIEIMTDPLKLFNHLSDDTKAYLTALFLVFPIWMTLLQKLLLSNSSVNRVSDSTTKPTMGSFAAHRDATMNGMIGVTSIMHVAGVLLLYQSVPKHVSFWQAVKHTLSVPAGLHSNTYAEAGYVFLLFNALILILATFVFVLVPPGRTASIPKLVSGMIGLSVVVGPGAALSWGWKVRENGQLSNASEKKTT